MFLAIAIIAVAFAVVTFAKMPLVNRRKNPTETVILTGWKLPGE